jgi:hypothetical protein
VTGESADPIDLPLAERAVLVTATDTTHLLLPADAGPTTYCGEYVADMAHTEAEVMSADCPLCHRAIVTAMTTLDRAASAPALTSTEVRMLAGANLLASLALEDVGR